MAPTPASADSPGLLLLAAGAIVIAWQVPYGPQALYPLTLLATFAHEMLAPAVLSRSAAHRSSMVQDIEGGRRTEIDTLNGAVARLGAAHGIATPTHDAIIALIKARSPS